jgi:hypothetical protein
MYRGAAVIEMFSLLILEQCSAWILPCVGSKTQQKDWSRSKVLELVVLACVGGHPELVDEKRNENPPLRCILIPTAQTFSSGLRKRHVLVM